MQPTTSVTSSTIPMLPELTTASSSTTNDAAMSNINEVMTQTLRMMSDTSTTTSSSSSSSTVIPELAAVNSSSTTNVIPSSGMLIKLPVSKICSDRVDEMKSMVGDNNRFDEMTEAVHLRVKVLGCISTDWNSKYRDTVLLIRDQAELNKAVSDYCLPERMRTYSDIDFEINNLILVYEWFGDLSSSNYVSKAELIEKEKTLRIKSVTIPLLPNRSCPTAMSARFIAFSTLKRIAIEKLCIETRTHEDDLDKAYNEVNQRLNELLPKLRQAHNAQRFSRGQFSYYGREVNEDEDWFKALSVDDQSLIRSICKCNRESREIREKMINRNMKLRMQSI